MENRFEDNRTPGYYGTGRQQEKQPQYAFLTWILLAVLVGVNLLSVAIQREAEAYAELESTEETAEATMYLPERKAEAAESSFLNLELSQLDEAHQQYWDLPGGLVVSRLSEDCAAYVAGLRAGDLLTAIGEQPVETLEDYRRLLQEYSPGDTLCLQCYRAGEFFTVEFTVGES